MLKEIMCFAVMGQDVLPDLNVGPLNPELLKAWTLCPLSMIPLGPIPL